MLKNSYIENYKNKTKKTKFLERELALLHNNDNYELNLHRPISTKTINKIPNNIFPVFIDDIMCNNEVNDLLYSSNAAKEINFYIKQKNSLLKYNTKEKLIEKKPKLNTLQEIILNRTNKQLVKSLKDKINKYNLKRNEILENYKNKQENFEKQQPNLENKLKKLYYKPVNEIRLEGYTRAFKNCLNKSKSDGNFNMPKAKFIMDDVYSRLSHNVILNPKTLRQKNSKEKEKVKEKEVNQNDNKIKVLKQMKKLKFIPIKKYQTIGSYTSKFGHKKNIKIKNKTYKYSDDYELSSSKNNSNINRHYYLRNMPSLNLTKILKYSTGKEFKIKITPRIKKRCLSVLSCGPKPKKIKNNLTSEKKSDESNDKIDYNNIRNEKIFNISKIKSKKNLKNLILYNTLLMDKNNRNRIILKVRNFRDENFNSNLHIAVINNSIKLVKYFLDKNFDPNVTNEDGQTPLHIAMQKGNLEIIKLLINSGADKEFKDNKGNTPIFFASKQIKHYLENN